MDNLYLKKLSLFERLKYEGISDKTIEAMKKIPRELFVPKDYQLSSYDNRPLTIGKGQTISQPYIVGYMIDQLNIDINHTILEIGCGSGYNLAILSLLSKYVISIERIPSLVERSKKVIKRLDINNCEIILGDGIQGYDSVINHFDRIVITAKAEKFPKKLFKQLKVGGIMVFPMEDEDGVYLYKLTKLNDRIYKIKRLISVSFVPLISKN